MSNFNACLSFTIGPGPDAGGEEGGYSNDRNDPGKATNFGASTPAWSDFIGHPATVAEMMALTRADVVPFYLSKYWNANRCWGLPLGVDLMVFDFAVNAGDLASADELQQAENHSARLLQLAVGVAQDDIIGPKTCLAAEVMGAAPLIAALRDLHSQHYEGLAQFDRYGSDWLGRTDRCRDAALAMLPPVSA